MNYLLTILLHRSRKGMCTMLIVLLSVMVNAQPVVKPDTDPANKGGTITETTTTVDGWKTKVSEKKDKNDKLLEKVTVEETADKRRKVRTIIFDSKGDTLMVLYTIFDRNGEATYRERRVYDGKKLVEDEQAWLNPDNKKYKWHILNPNGTYGDYGEKEPHENWDQHHAEPEKQVSVCPPRHEISVGYNYLNLAQGGGERLSVPLGARLTYQYRIGPRLSLDADVTYNIFKEEEIKQMWLFVLFGVSYQFAEGAIADYAKEKQGKGKFHRTSIIPYAEIRIGTVTHRYKFIDPLFPDDFNITTTNFGALAGGGVNVKTGPKTGLRFRADYAPIWYKDGGMESNFTAGVAFHYKFGCR